MNTPAGRDPIAWPRLRECIANGRVGAVIELLAPWPTEELGHLQDNIRTLYSELRKLERTTEEKAFKQYPPLLAAALASARTPAQAASWLTKSILLDTAVSHAPNSAFAGTRPGTILAMLIERHDAPWLGDLACRLAETLRPDPDWALWSIADTLARHSGAAVPLTDGYVVGWVSQAANVRYVLSGRTDDRTLMDNLRAEPRLRECIARVFEIDTLGNEFYERHRGYLLEDNRWPTCLVKLSEEGLLDRGDLLDGCTATLLRSARQDTNLRGYIGIYDELAPSPEEVGQRLATYLAMAASATAMAAKVALRELRTLDKETPLELHTFAGLCADVFARTETGLIGEQFSWIDAALKRDPAATGLLLRTLTAAFAHPAVSVQRRALKLIAKHAKKADADVLAELRAAVPSLDAALRAEAGIVLGEAGGGYGDAVGAPDEGLPRADEPAAAELPPYQPTPMPPAFEAPDELVAAFAAPLAGLAVHQAEVERIMAGVAALTHRDRPALAAALAPLDERYPCQGLPTSQTATFPGALRCLLEAALGVDHDHKSAAHRNWDSSPPRKPATVLRIEELADALHCGRTVPVLLATATAADGSIDPAILLSRIKAYEDAGAEPLRHDLTQALLRVSGHADPQLEAALEKWPPLPKPLPDFEEHYRGELPLGADTMPWARPLGIPRADERRKPLLSGSGGEEQSLFRSLVPAYDPDDDNVFARRVDTLPEDCWPPLLPHHPDLVAAHAIPTLYRQANGEDRGGPALFPRLAETAGRPGAVTHLALAYGLAADRLENRVAAQDAVLILAARGLLRADLLGRMAAALWKRHMIRPSRLLPSLGDVEQAGAAAEVFAVAAASIEEFAATPARRGLPDLLLLATRCATTKPVPGAQIAGLAGLAALAKPARVGQEARRLQSALAVPAQRSVSSSN